MFFNKVNFMLCHFNNEKNQTNAPAKNIIVPIVFLDSLSVIQSTKATKEKPLKRSTHVTILANQQA